MSGGTSSSTPTGWIGSWVNDANVYDQVWLLSARAVSEVRTRHLFDSVEHARAFLEDWISGQPASSVTRSGGQARRINAIGWAECFTVEKTYGEWRGGLGEEEEEEE